MRLIALVMLGTLVAGASPALGQTREVGLKAGVNVASMVDDGETGGYDGRRIGFLAGAFAVLPVRGPLAVQIEALFSQKGAKFDIDDQDAEATLELDYLDIPVMLRVQGPASGTTRLHFFGGPSVGIRTGARERLTYAAGNFDQGESTNIDDLIERFDFGVVVGAGVDVGRRIVVDARYQWGISTVNTDELAETEFKHRVFSILAGVRF